MKKVLFVCIMVLSLAALVFAGGKSDSASPPGGGGDNPYLHGLGGKPS
ncbi:MAG: hypothetical protein LBR96_04510 [Treponema sp.]|jgi:hypothetical protein|nr:hypothetical protein [Treponema sp.]